MARFKAENKRDKPDDAIKTMRDVIGHVKVFRKTAHCKDGFADQIEEAGRTTPIIAARVKKTKESADKTTFKADLKKMPIVTAPDRMILEGIDPAVREANREDMAVANAPVVDALNIIKAELKANTAVTKKGFDLFKPIHHKSLAELAEMFPPPLYEKEDKHWVLRKILSTKTGTVASYLGTLRKRGETYTINGWRYGRDTDNRVWCKRADVEREPKSRKIFYLRSSLEPSTLVDG